MPVRLLHAMAGDLGVMKIVGEDDAQFAARTAYTALRFWMQAYCLDDGYGGFCGLSESAIRRKAADWLKSVAAIYPDMAPWFGGTDGYADAATHVLGILIGTGDLVRTDEGLCRCTSAHLLAVDDRRSIVLGLTDPTGERTVSMSGMAYTRNTIKDAVIVPGPDSPEDHPYCANIKSLGRRHALIQLDTSLTMLPYHDKAIDMLVWPYRSVRDETQLVVRANYVTSIAELLAREGFNVSILAKSNTQK